MQETIGNKFKLIYGVGIAQLVLIACLCVCGMALE